MKILKKLMLFLLVIPVCFAFSACKNDKDKGDSNKNNNSQIEQPDDNNDDNKPSETFSVTFDYNLPEDYDFLLTDYSLNGNVNELISIPTVTLSKLKDYFLGWRKNGDGEILTGTISSQTAGEKIVLKGSWNEEGLKNYYYNDGLSFSKIDENNYSILGYTGTDKTIFIPKFYKIDGENKFITKISENAFLNSNVEKVLINTNSIDVENDAFKNSNLKYIDFQKIGYLGDNAFENTKISNVKFSINLNHLGDNVFENCKNLTTVDCSELALEFSDGLFSGCSMLNEIKNANYMTAVGFYSFSGCLALKNCDFLTHNIVKICDYAFENSGLESVKIPSGVFDIGANTFNGCTKLKNITTSRLYQISSSSNRFHYVLGSASNYVQNLVLEGDIVTEIPAYYFQDLIKLQNFTMNNSLTTIGEYAFYNTNLTNVNFSENFDYSNFSKSFASTKFLSELNNPVIKSNEIIYVPSNISKNYIIPSGVTKINDSVFAGSAIESITIPSTVAEIGVRAFEQCESLTTVIFEDNNLITNIPMHTFYSCSNLKSINLEKLSALESIGEKAFNGVNITNFEIPSMLQNLGEGAFELAKIKSFVMNENSNYFEVRNGVLYKKIASKLELVAYPKEKADELFIMPGEVSKVSAYAFSGAKYLSYVYITQNSIDWGTVKNAQGHEIPYCFERVNGIELFVNDKTIASSENNVQNYYLINGNYSFNDSTNEIKFDENFAVSEGYYYIKYYDNVSNKFSIVYFKISFNSEAKIDVTNLKKLDKVLDK